jgi:membrane protein YdbS with pleckstrin-like domain
MAGEQQHLFDKPRNVRRLLYALYSVCALLLAVEFLYQRHTQHDWDSWPGFYAGYGFVGCVLLVLIAKLLRRLLKRPEDYYDDGEEP